MLSKISSMLDAVADSLEAKGLIKEAYEIDRVADEIDKKPANSFGNITTAKPELYSKILDSATLVGTDGKYIFTEDGGVSPDNGNSKEALCTGYIRIVPGYSTLRTHKGTDADLAKFKGKIITKKGKTYTLDGANNQRFIDAVVAKANEDGPKSSFSNPSEQDDYKETLPKDVHSLYSTLSSGRGLAAKAVLKNGKFISFGLWSDSHAVDDSRNPPRDIWDIAVKAAEFPNLERITDDENHIYDKYSGYNHLRCTTNFLSKLIENNGGVLKKYEGY
jgi:hypothetical protein